MLIGLIVSPWLHRFAMQYVGLIVGTAVDIVLVVVFVAIGQVLAILVDATISAIPTGALVPGPNMLEIGVIQHLPS